VGRFGERSCRRGGASRAWHSRRVTAFDSLTRLGRVRRLRAVAAEALAHYDVRPHRLALQAESFNTMFRVVCSDEAYLLRVGPERPIHQPGAAMAEHDWTRSLATRGLKVPRVVLTVDGAASVSVTAPGVPGSRECSLLTWRTGRPIQRPVGQEDLTELAALCATFHDATEPMSMPPQGVLDGRRVLHFRIPNLLDDALTDHHVFRDAHAQAQDALDQLWCRPTAEPRLIHSDVTPSNVLRSRNRLAAVDFQDLTWGHVEQDLANTLFGITRGLDVDVTARAFRSGYERVRRWPELGDTLLADLFAARRLDMVNLALAQNRAGLAGYLDHHAAALRDYLVRVAG
jgi:Ser/Thr protein kinase RdoA (MazF antagonist)